MDGSCHQCAVGAGGKAAHLSKDGHIAHACGRQNFFKLLAHTLADGHDVVLGLLRAVRDAHAAGQVDIADMRTGSLLHPDSQPEQDGSQLRVVGIRDGVGGKERVDAELLCALLHQLFVAVDHLLLGHAVLGIAGLVHDLKALFALAQTEGAARVIAAEDVLRHTGDTLQKFHHGGIVQIDISAQLVGLLHIFHGSLVGGEHDIAAEGLVDAADILPDALLIVDMERRGHILNDLLCHRLGQKRFLFHSNIPLILYARGRSPQ